MRFKDNFERKSVRILYTVRKMTLLGAECAYPMEGLSSLDMEYLGKEYVAGTARCTRQVTGGTVLTLSS